MSASKPFRIRASGGFTLIELLISMVVGLVVIGAIITLYAGSSESTRFQSSIQRMEENGRFAIDILSRNLRMAGYDNPLSVFEVEQPLLQGTATASGALIALPNLKTGADTLGFRFEGGTKIRDCLGSPVAEGSYVTNLYGISEDNSLVCGTTPTNGMPLVEGIEDMQLRYGLDLNNDGITNRYVEAGNVSDWNQVVAIKIAVLVSTISNALASEETICMGCTVFTGVADRKIRSEFQAVIGIRN